MLIAALVSGVTKDDWRLTSFLLALTFISVSFHPAEVRRDGLRGSTIISLIVVSLAVGGVVYWAITR
jgi:hypothetical protein